MFKKFVLKNACDGHSWVGQGELRQKESSDYDISITLLKKKEGRKESWLKRISDYTEFLNNLD